MIAAATVATLLPWHWASGATITKDNVMPKSKTRKPTRPVQDKPGRPTTGRMALETAALALVQASLEVVREAELHITKAAREGDEEGVQKALSVHHALRSGSLGLLVAYSELAGLPDPRESEVVRAD